MAPLERRIVVFVLDGGTFEIINPMIKTDSLPNLKKIMDAGVHGNLISTVPPTTCPAFDSLLTGMSPGNLGIYGFLRRKKGSYDFIPALKVDCPNFEPIWNIICKKGGKVGIVDVPTSYYPYREISGFFIPGWISLKKDKIFPPELMNELEGLTEFFELDIEDLHKKEDDLLAHIYKKTKLLHEIIKRLMNTKDWHFLMIVFTGIDRVQHAFWQYMDGRSHDSRKVARFGNSIGKYYIEIDSIIGDLLKYVNSDNTYVFILSDHGFGPNYFQFNVNEWLLRKGYLHLSNVKKLAYLKFTRRVYKSLQNTALKYTLKKVFNYWKIREYTEDALALDPTLKGDLVDWSRTKAFGFSVSSEGTGAIYINLRNRETHGIVSPGAEYELLRSQLIQGLKDICSTKRLQIQIHKKEEVYHGKYLDQAPDIIFFVEHLSCVVSSGLGYDQVFCHPILRQAGHRPEGIFFAKGKGVKKNQTMEDLSLLDLAPTFLHILGIPIPSHMEGKVLKKIFNKDSDVFMKSVRYQESVEREEEQKEPFTKKDEERMRARLRALGYID